MKPLSDYERKRFLRYVDQGDIESCWRWLGGTSVRGYGYFTLRRRSQRAHRIAYRLFVGDPRHLHVLHKCDNPSCVNPAHLFLGTHTDNMRDMVYKGRNKVFKGEMNGCSKLKEDSVLQMRRLHNYGWSIPRLSRRFGVNIATTYSIVIGKSWKHVGGPIVLQSRNFATGFRHPKSKLTIKLAKKIRSESINGISQRELGRRYGISCSTVNNVVNGRTYREAVSHIS